MNIAFIFPGQGSQIVGMGKDFYSNFQIAKKTFQEVDEAVKYNLSKIIFSGPEEELTLTVNVQPALMAVSIAILNVLKQETGLNIENLCSYVAGHSLGEYTAITASNSLTLTDSAKLLQIRGRAMQEACQVGQGAMAACIGISLKELESLLHDINIDNIDIANDNIEGQIVVSGKNDSVDKVTSILKDLGYKAIKLKVSAPFHSKLMKPAEKQMEIAINNIKINNPKIPLIANVNAKITTDQNQIKQNLINQICSRVRWRETIDLLDKVNIDNVVEIGSGKVLTNMIKKSNKYKFNLLNIGTIGELNEVIKTLYGA